MPSRTGTASLELAGEPFRSNIDHSAMTRPNSSSTHAHPPAGLAPEAHIALDAIELQRANFIGCPVTLGGSPSVDGRE